MSERYDPGVECCEVPLVHVHVLGDAVEVADTREGDADELLEELIHLDVAQGDLRTDRHAAAELEVGDVLLGHRDDGLLASDDGEFLSGLLDDLLVLGGVTDTFVDGDLEQTGNLHRGSIGELLRQLLHDFLFVNLLERRNVALRRNDSLCGCFFLCHNYLISSPDFLAKRTFLSPSIR